MKPRREKGNIEPTTGSDYDNYLWPHSKLPEKEELYAKLRELGWRYNAATAEFHTPQDNQLQGRGRLEWDPKFTWARIVGPRQGKLTRPDPLLSLVRVAGVWVPQARR